MFLRFARCAAAALLLASPALSSKPETTADPVFKKIDGIVRTLSSITGFSEEHAVPYGRMTQPELRRFLAKRLKKALKPKELYINELTLKMFGLVPQNYDLEGSTVDLLTEQAAAFYDYQEKRLFLLESASLTSEETTLAHELSHALADQHYPLDKFVDNNNDGDKDLAHTAVVEGQASWLMLAYARREQGLPGPPAPDQLKSIYDSGDPTSNSEYPVLDKSPLYVQQSLMFPYTEGTRFFNEVFQKRGKEAFGEVFTDPPIDTAQIYHVDRYFQHAQPTAPKLPDLDLADGQKELTDGALGEFDHRMMIWQFASRTVAMKLSAAVLGGEYRIVETGKKKHDRHPVLEYISEWNTEKDAKQFFTLYRKGLKTKWKRCDWTEDEPALATGAADPGYFVLKQLGRFVFSVEGIQAEEDWKRLRNQVQTF